MTLFRIYATAGRTDLICTANYRDARCPQDALERVRENQWVNERMTNEAWAEEVGEVLEG